MNYESIQKCYRDINNEKYWELPRLDELDEEYSNYLYTYLQEELYAVKKRGFAGILVLVEANSPVKAVNKVIELIKD